MASFLLDARHPALDSSRAIVQGAPPLLRPKRFPAGISRNPAMAKSDITGKRKLKAQNVSHSNIKTKRWQNVNIQTRRVWVPELNRFVSLKLTTRDIRTIDKIGVMAYAKRHGVKL
jgi:large subunit ribosomal protein L28